MDESLQELENELKRLTPRRPSAGLRQALERELGPVSAAAPSARYSTATNLGSWQWITWSMAAAAAIACVAVLQLARRPAVPTTPVPTELAAPRSVAPVAVASNRYEPVQATSVLYDLKEDGAATLPDRSEGRQLRYRYVDTYTWKNPTTNASLRWSVPRDEVRLIRASLD
jgi:anti-sigma-K factor RskA